MKFPKFRRSKFLEECAQRAGLDDKYQLAPSKILWAQPLRKTRGLGGCIELSQVGQFESVICSRFQWRCSNLSGLRQEVAVFASIQLPRHLAHE
jgi:hypothetical protein